MNSHKNAPLTPKWEAMVRSVMEGGLSQADAAYQIKLTTTSQHVESELP
jgi:hypothetical protein